MNDGRIRAALGQVHRLFGEGTTAGLTDAQLLERFASVGDGASFEALVTRHGRMVLAVCRDILKDPHDAEDAFQATFLVLVKKAGTLWLRGSLSSWLYCVAYRVALQANKATARRRASEWRRGLEMNPGSERPGPWHDLLPALHEEIDRLPEKFRAPVVLCEFEGLTRDEAAEQLGIPPG
ncbi:RNA polymerase sigma factor, partial [Singulisphaera rosea]